jgi:hypothetical protein
MLYEAELGQKASLSSFSVALQVLEVVAINSCCKQVATIGRCCRKFMLQAIQQLAGLK